MFTIEGTHEVVNTNLVEARQREITGGVYGLGPDDLVSLTKEEIGFFSNRTLHGYHHICGLVVDNAASFAAYFAELLEHQEKGRIPISKPFSLRKGRLFCFNSFANRDIVIAVECPGGCAAETVNRGGKTIKVSEKRWKQVRLSTLLRFYRGGNPTFASLFGSEKRSSAALKVFDGGPLAYEDFVYIGNRHPLSDELQFALAVALFVNLRPTQIREWLELFGFKFVNIVPHLFQFAFPGSSFDSDITGLIDHALSHHCDNVTIAATFVESCLRRNETEKLHRVLSLLKTASALDPRAGISLAKICIHQREFEQAFSYLNLVGFILSPPQVQETPAYQTISPLSGIPYGLSQPEKYLTKAPLNGLYEDYIQTIGQLILALGRDNFNELVRIFTTKYGLARTNPTSPIVAVHRASVDDESQHLYDPGIESAKVAFPGVSDLPIASGFKSAIREVQRSLVMYQLLKKSGEKVTDITSQLILAVRWKDGNFLNKIIRYAVPRQVISGVDKLLMLRGVFIGLGPPLQRILEIEGVPQTVTERNAMKLAMLIARAAAGDDAS